mmetsp:Transcript_54908/g.164399  ORF Transcript_54908/g.164399 Transcript_54908/m.164399 type:complete len:237 (-) Transcript_54908:1200-1910(-)
MKRLVDAIASRICPIYSPSRGRCTMASEPFPRPRRGEAPARASSPPPGPGPPGEHHRAGCALPRGAAGLTRTRRRRMPRRRRDLGGRSNAGDRAGSACSSSRRPILSWEGTWDPGSIHPAGVTCGHHLGLRPRYAERFSSPHRRPRRPRESASTLAPRPGMSHHNPLPLRRRDRSPPPTAAVAGRPPAALPRPDRARPCALATLPRPPPQWPNPARTRRSGRTPPPPLRPSPGRRP